MPRLGGGMGLEEVEVEEEGWGLGCECVVFCCLPHERAGGLVDGLAGGLVD